MEKGGVYCIQGNIRPRFIFVPRCQWANLSETVFSLISLLSQLCQGKFKTERNRLQVLKAENNTGENNSVYSISKLHS